MYYESGISKYSQRLSNNVGIITSRLFIVNESSVETNLIAVDIYV